MVICLERDADLHMAKLMPLPLTVSCFNEIQIGFTFLVTAHLGCPGRIFMGTAFPCVPAPLHPWVEGQGAKPPEAEKVLRFGHAMESANLPYKLQLSVFWKLSKPLLFVISLQN